MTFGGRAPFPLRRNDWPALASAARRLLTERQRHYPALVASERLTVDQAAHGQRVARAVALMFERFASGGWLPYPDDWADCLGATVAEMADDLARAAERAETITTKNPRDFDSREHADLIAALAWHLEPIGARDPYPQFWLAHESMRLPTLPKINLVETA